MLEEAKPKAGRPTRRMPKWFERHLRKAGNAVAAGGPQMLRRSSVAGEQEWSLRY